MDAFNSSVAGIPLDRTASTAPSVNIPNTDAEPSENISHATTDQTVVSSLLPGDSFDTTSAVESSPIFSHVPQSGSASAGTNAMVAVAKPNAARHAAQIVSFLRARHHEFSYSQDAYPDTSKWGNPIFNDIKRQTGGHSHQELNCWGLVFYVHYRTGNLSKRSLEARALACDTATDSLTDRLQKTEVRAQYLRSDLIGDNLTVPVDQVDFTSIPVGSTVVFHRAGRKVSHVAIMLDNNEMAHLIQSLCSKEAITRKDVAQGTLEITSPAAVIRLVQEMPFGHLGVFVGHSNGPSHFIPSTQDLTQ
ncbi:MAG: hypothetical protein JWQ21_535 [Herminiimonas sp.]|nr:hypothetical protein [Herminiimonas sp.]